MKNIISFIVFSFLLFSYFAEAEDVFLLYLTIHKNDTITLKFFDLLGGEVNIPSEGQGAYEIRVLSHEKEVLFSGKRHISFQTFREWIDERTGNMQGELIELDEIDGILRVPYFYNAEKIEIYKNGKLLYSLNISDKLCVFDGKCLDYCKDKNDKDCLFVEETEKEQPTTSFLILSFLTILLLSLLLVFVKFRKYR